MSRRAQLLALLAFAVACVLLWLRRRQQHALRLLSRKITSASKPAECGKQFHAFLSHFKVEAATEARWLQEQLEEALGGRVFLDSDYLHDLTRLQDHVRESRVLVFSVVTGLSAPCWQGGVV